MKRKIIFAFIMVIWFIGIVLIMAGGAALDSDRIEIPFIMCGIGIFLMAIGTILAKRFNFDILG